MDNKLDHFCSYWHYTDLTKNCIVLLFVSYNSTSVYIVEELVSYNDRYSNVDASCNERHLNGILEHDY
jgi:hypothetical protein